MEKGIVSELKGAKQTYCFIKTESEELFSHAKDFVNPSHMRVGQVVMFRRKMAKDGQRPHATDVQAA